MTTDALPDMACAVCARVVDTVTDENGVVGYRHTLATENADHPDHLVVAVPVEQVHPKYLCDFCTAEGASWELPVEDYSVGGTGSVGNWAACEDCAALLRTKDWSKLADRASKAFSAKHPDASMAPQIFRLMYAELRRHVTGDVRPTERR